MNLQELKIKKPPELLAFAEEQGVEGAAMMRRQELMFAILQKVAAADQAIFGVGTIEVAPDGFGYLRSMEANYLPGADDIYVSPTQVRKFGLRTGDTVEGEIRAPKDGERYFAMVQINKINFDDPDSLRHRINFNSLTPLYPDEKLKLEMEGGAAVMAPTDLRGAGRLARHLVGPRQHRAAPARSPRRPARRRSSSSTSRPA